MLKPISDGRFDIVSPFRFVAELYCSGERPARLTNFNRITVCRCQINDGSVACNCRYVNADQTRPIEITQDNKIIVRAIYYCNVAVALPRNKCISAVAADKIIITAVSSKHRRPVVSGINRIIIGVSDKHPAAHSIFSNVDNRNRAEVLRSVQQNIALIIGRNFQHVSTVGGSINLQRAAEDRRSDTNWHQNNCIAVEDRQRTAESSSPHRACDWRKRRYSCHRARSKYVCNYLRFECPKHTSHRRD